MVFGILHSVRRFSTWVQELAQYLDWYLFLTVLTCTARLGARGASHGACLYS